MECVHGVARLPTVGGGEPTEEVYLLPDTGRPGAEYDKVCVLDFKILVVGGWAPWSSWQECDIQCLTSRSRQCNQGRTTFFEIAHVPFKLKLLVNCCQIQVFLKESLTQPA